MISTPTLSNGPLAPTAIILLQLAPWLAVAFILIIVFLIFLKLIYKRVYARFHSAFGKVVLLVTVPKDSAKDKDKQDTLEAQREDISVAETLFAGLGGMRAERGIKALLFGRTDHLAVEIVATRGLISFYVSVPGHLQRYVEQQIEAQYTEAQIEQVHDYNMFVPRGAAIGAVMKFQRPFMFPIKTYKEIDSDPMATITNAMSRLGENGAAIQIIARSAKRG